MYGTQRTQAYQRAIELHEAGLMSRRQIMRIMGALGLGAVATSALGSIARAQEGSPVPMATPQIGAQADGTTLWKVLVGGMDMENAIEYHGFFPGEITINAGDSIWFAYEMPMFHTVTFPVAGGEVPGILIPDPEAAAPATPAAGPPKLIYNPIVLTGAGGTVVDGSQLVSSPADVFARPGDGAAVGLHLPDRRHLRLRLHPAQQRDAGQGDRPGRRVGAADGPGGATTPPRRSRSPRSRRRVWPRSSSTASRCRPTSRTAASSGRWRSAPAARRRSRVQRFLPGELEIAAGDTIKYVNRSEGEPHTATLLGAGETAPEDTIVEAFADGSPKFVQNMETFLPAGRQRLQRHRVRPLRLHGHPAARPADGVGGHLRHRRRLHRPTASSTAAPTAPGWRTR